jgi:L-lactate permease
MPAGLALKNGLILMTLCLAFRPLMSARSLSLVFVWPQPLAPAHGLGVSALIATLPLAVVLIMMGGLRKSGVFSAAMGLATALLLALFVWHMPPALAIASSLFGGAYAVWPILWIVFSALWLYNLSVEVGNFDLLRCWMAERASGDPCVQVILVAFCFGALLEGTAGFGSPVAVAGFLLLGLGFPPRKAVTLALIANTTPVAFGALGIPIVALAGVTGLNLMKLSAMVGRQLPFLSLILPAYLALVVGGGRGLKRVWPVALAGGGSFALAQFVCSNFWGPYAADVVAAMFSTACVVMLLHVWKPAPSPTTEGAPPVGNSPKAEATLTTGQSFAAWAPWVILAAVMIAWSYFHLFNKGEQTLLVPHLHN